MTGVFLDTVGLIAVWDDSDQWHAVADAAYRRLLARTLPLMTTTLVLCECGNAASRRPYRADVCELREFLVREQLLIEPTLEEVEDAWTAYAQAAGPEARESST